MTQQDIKNKINENNSKIKQLFFSDTFVLNSEMSELLKENEELQKICNHVFSDGFCIYCMKEEE